MDRLLRHNEILSAIERAFVDPPVAPQRLAAESAEGPAQTRTLLAMPAIRRGGIATVKLVTALRGENAGLSSHLAVFDACGELLAIIEAHQLTARRTAAASVLAAKTLGAGQARHLAVLGAGRQARAQIEAFADAMPLERITIWARRSEAAAELAHDFAKTACDIQIAATPSQAVHDADIVTCATPSQAPLVIGDDVATGTHVDLVGGFRPDMREADDGLLARAMIVADTPAALIEAGDLVQPIASGAISGSNVLFLADLLAGTVSTSPRDITVFKSVGHAAEDLVVAELLLERLGILDADTASTTGTGSTRPQEQHDD